MNSNVRRLTWIFGLLAASCSQAPQKKAPEPAPPLANGVVRSADNQNEVKYRAVVDEFNAPLKNPKVFSLINGYMVERKFENYPENKNLRVQQRFNLRQGKLYFAMDASNTATFFLRTDVPDQFDEAQKAGCAIAAEVVASLKGPRPIPRPYLTTAQDFGKEQECPGFTSQ